MDTPAAAKSPQPKQPLTTRIGFFVLGGLGSTSLNWSVLHFATHILGWPQDYGFALSTVSTAFVFFLWSYFVNFRTSRVWKNCLGRYIACQLLIILMTYLIGRSGLRHFGPTPFLKYLVILVVQSFTGSIKFFLYHLWVFPHADGPVAKEPAVVAS